MNEELQKAIDEITKEMLADGKEPWEINAVIQKYLASKGVYGDKTDQDDNVAKEQSKKQEVLSPEQTIERSGAHIDQSFWSDESRIEIFGNREDYERHPSIEGAWVNKKTGMQLSASDPISQQLNKESDALDLATTALTDTAKEDKVDADRVIERDYRTYFDQAELQGVREEDYEVNDLGIYFKGEPVASFMRDGTLHEPSIDPNHARAVELLTKKRDKDKRDDEANIVKSNNMPSMVPEEASNDDTEAVRQLEDQGVGKYGFSVDVTDHTGFDGETITITDAHGNKKDFYVGDGNWKKSVDEWMHGTVGDGLGNDNDRHGIEGVKGEGQLRAKYQTDDILEATMDMASVTPEQINEIKNNVVKNSDQFVEYSNVLNNTTEEQRNADQNTLIALQDSAAQSLGFNNYQEFVNSFYREDVVQQQIDALPYASQDAMRAIIELELEQARTKAKSSASYRKVMTQLYEEQGWDITYGSILKRAFGDDIEGNPMFNTPYDHANYMIGEDESYDALVLGRNKLASKVAQVKLLEAKKQYADSINMSEEERANFLRSDVAPEKLFGLEGFEEIFNSISNTDEAILIKAENLLTKEQTSAAFDSNIEARVDANSDNWLFREEADLERRDQAQERFKNLQDEEKTLFNKVQVVADQYENNKRNLDATIDALDKFNVKEKRDAIIAKFNSGDLTKAEAESQLSSLKQEYDDLYNTYVAQRDAHKMYRASSNQLQLDLQDLQMDIEDFEIYASALGRNTTWMTRTLNNIPEWLAKLGTGIVTIVEYGAFGIEGALESATGKDYNLDPFSDKPIVSNFKSEDELLQEYVDSGYLTYNQADVNAATYLRRGMNELNDYRNSFVGRNVELGEVSNPLEFGDWLTTTFARSAPDLALAALTNGGWLYVMGAGIAGNTFEEGIEEDILYQETGGLYGEDHSWATIGMSGLAVGAAEVLSERITLGILDDTVTAMKGLRRAADDVVVKGVQDSTRKYLRKTFSREAMGKEFQDFMEEGLSEAAATIGENVTSMLMGDEDTYIFQDVDVSFVSGVGIAGLIKTPKAFKAARAPFVPMSADKRFREIQAQENSLYNELNDKNTSEPRKVEIQQELGRIAKEKLDLNRVILNRADAMSTEDKKSVVDIQGSQNQIALTYRRLMRKVNGLKSQLDSGQITQEQYDAKLAALNVDAVTKDLSERYSQNEKLKQKVLNKYDVDKSTKRYKRHMKRVKQLARDASKNGGVKTNVTEYGYNGFLDFVAEYEYSNEQVEKFKAKQLAVLNKDNSTDKQKSNAQRNLDMMDSHLRMAASKDGAGSAFGAMVPILDADGNLLRFELAINSNTAVDADKFTTASHEFLHAVMYNTLKKDVAIQDAFGAEITDLVTGPDTKMSEEAQNEYWDRVRAYQAEGRGEEQMTVFSEMLSEGKIKFTDNIFKKINRLIRGLSMSMGMREIKFDNKEDLKDFLSMYSRTVNSRVATALGIRNRGLEKMLRDGAKGKIVERGTKESERRKQQGEHKTKKDNIAFSKAVNRAIENDPDLIDQFDDTLIRPDGKRITTKEEYQNSPANWGKAWEKIAYSSLLDNLIVIRARQENVPEKVLSNPILRSEFVQRVKERLSEKFGREFDPAKNESLFGWLAGKDGGAMKWAIRDIKKESAQNPLAGGVSLDDPIGEGGTTRGDLMADEDLISAGRPSQDPDQISETKVLDSIEISDDAKTKIQNEVRKANIDAEKFRDLGYKGVKEATLSVDKVPVMKDGKPVLNKSGKPKMKNPTKTSEVKFTGELSEVLKQVAAEFGVNPKKVPSRLSLTNQERDNIRDYISRNIVGLHTHRPEQHSTKGKSTGVPPKYLDAHYDAVMKDGKKVRGGTQAATDLGFLGMDAQGTELYTVKEQTIPEYAAQYGIEGVMNEKGEFVETGRVSNTDGSFDGLLHGQVAVTAGSIANETVREQELEKNPTALEIVAIIGDGKGLLSYSKPGFQKLGKFNNLLDEVRIFGFREGANKLSQNIFNSIIKTEEDDGIRLDKMEDDRIREMIRLAVKDTYGEFFDSAQEDLLVDAIYDIVRSNKIPKTDGKDKVNPKRAVKIKEQLERLNLDEDFYVGAYTGVSRSRQEIMSDPDIIDDHRGYAMDFFRTEQTEVLTLKDKENKLVYKGPLAQGLELIKRMALLQQQMATAGTVRDGYKNVGGKRGQWFQNSKDFWDNIKKSSGLNFSIKQTKDINGKVTYSIDYSKPITFTPPGGSPQTLPTDKVKEAVAMDGQNGKQVIIETITDFYDGTKKIEQRQSKVNDSRAQLDRFTAYHTKLHESGAGYTAEHLAAAMWNQLSNMKPTLARAAMPKYIGNDMLPPNWKTIGKKKALAWVKANLTKGSDLEPVFEHMQPRVTVVIDLFNNHLFEGRKTIDEQFANYDVAIISDRMDVKGLKAAKLNNALAAGQTLSMPSWIRYYNNQTMQTGVMVGLTGIGTNKDVNIGDAHVRANEFIQQKREALRQTALANGMVAFSRPATEGAKGITVLDFDDTLATTKSQVIVTAPDGSTFKLNAEEFAKRGADLLAEGHVFDFSEFNQVVGGQTAPLFNKALKLAGKFGTKDMFILTARPPEAQPAIKQFLDANGLNIPIENIVGLGNSTAQAKADWIAGKIGEGYNDFYFADDAIQNVEAVSNMLDQHDVKGKVQQAKLQFSLDGPKRMNDMLDEAAREIDAEFNEILEQTKGVGREKRFSAAKARKRGQGKGRFKFFLPPSAEDFKGLIYPFLGKGKVGEKHHEWFKKNLFDPFSKGMRHMQMVSQAVANDIKELKKALPEVRRILRQKIPGLEFTYQDAIRVYNWNRMGIEVPGLSISDLNQLLNTVRNNESLLAFADGLNSSMQLSIVGDITPGNSWLAGTIESDIADAVKSARKIYLKEFIDNSDIVFSEANLNKIEAVYGRNHREAIEDILYRMKTGSTRNFGSSRILNNFMQWINGSVGATMFFNARSAMLQMISNVNFINWSDNNFLAAAKAFANQPQYWADVAMIFNSPWLKDRRGGIGTDLNAAELLQELQGSKNQMKSAIAYMLKIGFTPTQIADSLAIATGGATFYRNRVNTYIKQGMTKAEAESKAYDDMRDIAEESQQSTREDKISQQQASPLGKMILAFQNVTMQYNRLMKRAAQDWVNGRGDWKTHASKIVYYGAVQNFIFYGLQQALFASLFGDDEEDQMTEKKKVSLLNGMLDSLLRGAGIAGAVVSTAKNTVLEFMEQNAKLEDDKFYTDFNEGAIILEALNLSPPIGIKARKLNSALQTWHYNDDIIKHMDKTDIDNPMYEALFNATEAITNAPLHRLYNKFMNIREAMDSDHETWKRVAMFLGWSRWSFGIQNQDVMTARDEVREIKAAEAEERREQKKREREIEKAEEERQVIEDNKLDQEEKREDGATEVQCAAVSRSGKRCSNTALPGKSFCTVHDEVPQQANEVQCSHIKDNGERCKMKTKNKSGKCYYHD
jgi:hypothetical protein